MQISCVAHDFRNSADAEGQDRFSETHRLENAEAEALVFGGVKAGVGRGQEIFHNGSVLADDDIVAQIQLVDETAEGRERRARQDQQSNAIAMRGRRNNSKQQVDAFGRPQIGHVDQEKLPIVNSSLACRLPSTTLMPLMRMPLVLPRSRTTKWSATWAMQQCRRDILREGI